MMLALATFARVKKIPPDRVFEECLPAVERVCDLLGEDKQVSLSDIGKAISLVLFELTPPLTEIPGTPPPGCSRFVPGMPPDLPREFFNVFYDQAVKAMQEIQEGPCLDS